MLADSFHAASKDRRYFLTSGLNKAMASTLAEAPITALLFGDDLPQRVQQAKDLEKSSAMFSRRSGRGNLNSKRPSAHPSYQPRATGGLKARTPRNTYKKEPRQGYSGRVGRTAPGRHLPLPSRYRHPDNPSCRQGPQRRAY